LVKNVVLESFVIQSLKEVKKITCQEALILLFSFDDDEKNTAAFAHVENCPICRVKVSALELSNDAFAGLLRVARFDRKLAELGRKHGRELTAEEIENLLSDENEPSDPAPRPGKSWLN
jgi:hypothetical protein